MASYKLPHLGGAVAAQVGGGVAAKLCRVAGGAATGTAACGDAQVVDACCASSTCNPTRTELHELSIANDFNPHDSATAVSGSAISYHCQLQACSAERPLA